MKSAVLLVNLGSPKSPSVADVRAYLREFLIDPLVIVGPAIFRWILVNGIIAPFRSPKSAEAYAKIWNAQTGSPLLYHSQNMANKLATELPDMQLRLAMRYGEPSLRAAIQQILFCDRLYVLPMYPQFAESSSGSVLVEVRKICRELQFKGELLECRSFSAHPGFINAVTENIAREIEVFHPDCVLLSYHGLPIRQVGGYRDECFATSSAIVEQLSTRAQWPKDKTLTGFQSRLNNRWIQPFSDHFFRTLSSQGVRRLLVACPSFVADCLETLEEIAMRGREEFCFHGGEDLKLVPCLNDSPMWVKTVTDIVRDPNYWHTGAR